jgi:hypothetical protein
MVAQEWLKTADGLPISPTAIGRTLPNLENNASIAASGFLQVGSVVGGTPETEVLKRRSVLELISWTPPRGRNMDKPTWNRAGDLMEAVVESTYDQDPLNVQRLLTMPTGFRNARVMSVEILTEPREVEGDEASWAGSRVEAQFNWIMMPDA